MKIGSATTTRLQDPGLRSAAASKARSPGQCYAEGGMCNGYPLWRVPCLDSVLSRHHNTGSDLPPGSPVAAALDALIDSSTEVEYWKDVNGVNPSHFYGMAKKHPYQ